VFLPTKKKKMKLYHITGQANRESILQLGLDTSFAMAHEAIYLSDTIQEEDKTFDIWEIDGDLLTGELAEDSDMLFCDTNGATWYAYYDNIPVEKIRLISPH
jgi:hypothetical protein